MEYLPIPETQSFLSPHSADMMGLWDARSLVLDVGELFKERDDVHPLHYLCCLLLIILPY